MKMFSYLGVAHGQLSLPGWRTLTGLHVLWLEVVKRDISVRELRGLYQFKKPKGPGIAYFSPWGDHGHIVEGNPALKKGYRKGWFVAEGRWGTETLGEKGDPVEVPHSFNVDCKYLPYLWFFIGIFRLNVSLTLSSLCFRRCDMG